MIQWNLIPRTPYKDGLNQHGTMASPVNHCCPDNTKNEVIVKASSGAAENTEVQETKKAQKADPNVGNVLMGFTSCQVVAKLNCGWMSPHMAKLCQLCHLWRGAYEHGRLTHCPQVDDSIVFLTQCNHQC